MRGWRLQNRWKNAIGLQMGTQKLIRFVVAILLVCHWMACLWGLVGLQLAAELCDTQGKLFDFGDAGVSINEVSWVTTIFLGGKTSPDDPCNPFEVYAAALHWAVMTLTSIGYGDIVPVRLEEYLVAIMCQLLGGVMWAYVIGSVVSIISNVSPVERNFETNSDLLNQAMEEAGIPKKERPEYREYLREAKAYDRRMCFIQVAENFSPMLRKQLLHHSTRGALNSVPYFNHAEATPLFLMDLASLLRPRFFSRFERLDDVRQYLCLVDHGTVANCGQVLVHPAAFNQDFIVADRRFKKSARTVSLTFAQIFVLAKSDLDGVLESHPLLAEDLWVSAMKMAFRGAMQLTAEAYLRWKATKPPGTSLTLCEAFDKFRRCHDPHMWDHHSHHHHFFPTLLTSRTDGEEKAKKP